MTRPPRLLAAALAVAVLGACGTPTPEQALCAATLAMADDLQTDGEPNRASIDAFVAASAEVGDRELRDPAARAASELATSPDEAMEPLGTVYERCVELGLIEDATQLPVG